MKLRGRLSKGYKEVQLAKRKSRKGRAMEGMVMGVRRGIEVGKREEEEESLMSRMIRLEREEWKIVGVYVTGDLEEKWEKLWAWAEGGSEGIRTIVEDFNVRTGRMGDSRKEEMGQRRARRSNPRTAR